LVVSQILQNAPHFAVLAVDVQKLQFLNNSNETRSQAVLRLNPRLPDKYSVSFETEVLREQLAQTKGGRG
jgi:hypothetical protein